MTRPVLTSVAWILAGCASATNVGLASGTTDAASVIVIAVDGIYDPLTQLDHDGYTRWLADQMSSSADPEIVHERWAQAGPTEQHLDQATWVSRDARVIDYDGMEQLVDILDWIEHDVKGKDILGLGGVATPTSFERELAQYYGRTLITSFCDEDEVVAYWIVHRWGPALGGTVVGRSGEVMWTVAPIPAYRVDPSYIMVVPLPVGAAGRAFTWALRGAGRALLHAGVLPPRIAAGMVAHARQIVHARRAARIGQATGSTIQANRIAGMVGERHLLGQFGGRSQVVFRTSKGVRVVDNLADGVARESKHGRVYFSKRIRRQVDKDIELLTNSEAVDAVAWHFFRGRTGIGPSGPLRKKLEDAGIGIVIH